MKVSLFKARYQSFWELLASPWHLVWRQLKDYCLHQKCPISASPEFHELHLSSRSSEITDSYLQFLISGALYMLREDDHNSVSYWAHLCCDFSLYESSSIYRLPLHLQFISPCLINEKLNSEYSSASEEGMATHSSILAWEIPWTEEPGGLQSMGHRVRHDWVSSTFSFPLDGSYI